MTDWSRFVSWDLVLPPNRPTTRFLDIVRKMLFSRITARGPVALLGSTPEFRDLLNKNQVRDVHIFEKDETFYLRSSAIMLTHGTNDHLVMGDWRDTIQKFPKKFSMVVSDLTSGNIPYKDAAAFYRDIGSALVNGGVFVDRILTYRTPLLSLDLLDMKFGKLPCNIRTYNDFSSEYLFCSELLSGLDTVDSTMFYDILATRHRTDPYLTSLNRRAQLITPKDCVWHYGKLWGELSSGYLSHFSSTEIFEDEAGTVFSGRTKILISTK